MKKSKVISLVLVCAALASCNKEEKRNETDKDWSSVNYRTDNNAMFNSMMMWWMWSNAFRPYGYYNGRAYQHVGYEGRGLSNNANYGKGTPKSYTTNAINRGGFGKTSFRVSS